MATRESESQSTEPIDVESLVKQTQPPEKTQPSEQTKAVETAGYLKALSLVLVTLQTTLMVVLTRYTRVGDREAYSVCTMVIMTELLKLVFSVILLSKEVEGLGRAMSGSWRPPRLRASPGRRPLCRAPRARWSSRSPRCPNRKSPTGWAGW